MNFRRRSNGFAGVPKCSLKPEGATANSLKLVLPTNVTFRCRAIARQAASLFAGRLFFARYSEPAVVTTPLMSMLSFTASLSLPLPSAGGQYAMNALFPASRGAGRGCCEQPPRRPADISRAGIQRILQQCFFTTATASAPVQPHAPVPLHRLVLLLRRSFQSGCPSSADLYSSALSISGTESWCAYKIVLFSVRRFYVTK